MERRIKIIFGMFCLWFIVLVLRLWDMQVLHRERYVRMSIKNRVRIVKLPAARGRIYDRNGRIIAANKAAVQLVINGEDTSEAETDALDISRITGFSPQYIMKKIKDSIYKPFLPSVLAENMTEPALVAAAESMYRFPELSIHTKPIRDYPIGGAGAHVIGYVGSVTGKEIEKGYSWGDITGRVGIEKAQDAYLRGADGIKKVQVDYRGRVDSVLNTVRPKAGRPLYLTIDLGLQTVLYRAMMGMKGAGVVMDPSTGSILAMVSVPSFDPNILISPVKETDAVRLFTDKNKPMLNRAVSGLYPPGSVFKIITAFAALDRNVITKDTLFYCDGVFRLGDSVFRCWKKNGHGWMELSNALKRSCNEYFYQAGIKTGASALCAMAQRFGFGRYTGICLSEEKKGFLPAGGIKKRQWYKGDTVSLSIGQGKILVTPLQVVCMISAVANGGIVYRPRLCRFEGIKGIPAGVDKKYIDIVRDALVRVVEEAGGTGRRADISGVKIAGKTGTVELKEGGRKRNICWFAGFAPAVNPEIAVCIVSESGESGGATAGPVARRVFKEWFGRKVKQDG